MGYTQRLPYRLEVLWSDETDTLRRVVLTWEGRPTRSVFESRVRGLEDSTQPGRVNAHLGVHTIYEASLIRQSTGEVVQRIARPGIYR